MPSSSSPPGERRRGALAHRRHRGWYGRSGGRWQPDIRRDRDRGWADVLQPRSRSQLSPVAERRDTRRDVRRVAHHLHQSRPGRRRRLAGVHHCVPRARPCSASLAASTWPRAHMRPRPSARWRRSGTDCSSRRCCRRARSGCGRVTVPDRHCGIPGTAGLQPAGTTARAALRALGRMCVLRRPPGYARKRALGGAVVGRAAGRIGPCEAPPTPTLIPDHPTPGPFECPNGGQHCTALEIPPATGRAGERVTISVVLHDGNLPIAGTQNDLTLPPGISVVENDDGIRRAPSTRASKRTAARSRTRRRSQR